MKASQLHPLSLIILVSVFITVVLYLIDDSRQCDHKSEKFNVDLCHPYEAEGRHCPYRVKYRNGNRAIKLWANQNNTPNTENRQGSNSTQNNESPTGIDFNNLIEDHHYIKAFDKYPVYLDQTNPKFASCSK